MKAPEQIKAREHKQAVDANLQAFHAYVCTQLESPRKDEILHRASARIKLWQEQKLCSDYYIRFWSSVVRAGDTETFKSKVLNASKRRSAAMMQNTPFSFLLRERI